jgi:hypothetical protein
MRRQASQQLSFASRTERNTFPTALYLFTILRLVPFAVENSNSPTNLGELPILPKTNQELSSITNSTRVVRATRLKPYRLLNE